MSASSRPWLSRTIRTSRKATARAIEMARLLEGRYASCQKVIVVCDNLNTHTSGAFYEAFEPERARRLVRHIEFCDCAEAWQLAEYRRE